MLYAIALQAMRAPGKGGVAARQVILIPAAGLAFGRRISTTNPRLPWKPIDFSLGADAWGWSSVTRDLDATGWERGEAPPVVAATTWQFAMDAPVLFHVKDDEYRDLRNGDMPRNVALRYQRAVEAHNAVLLGVHAVSVTAAADALRARHKANDTTLVKAPGETMSARLAIVLSKVDEAIHENRTGMLDNYVPREARAKGAGSHRNHDNLPHVADAAPAPEAVAYVEPAPVVVKGGDVVKPGDVVPQPNGQPYYARPIEIGVKDLSDIEFFRRVGARGEHILIAGQPGTGKTASLTAAFGNVITLVCTPETESDDLYGGYTAVLGDDGREQLIWTDGPLIRAMEAGVPLYLDEIFLAPGNQLSPLFPLMDGRNVIERIAMNPARGRIEAKPGFIVIGSYNPDSARNMNDALLSRFTVKLTHSTDYGLLRRIGVSPRAVDFGEHLDTLRQNGEAGWSPQFRELVRFKSDEEAFGTLYAVQNLLSAVPEMETEYVVGHARERWGDIPRAAKKIKPLGL